MITNTSALCIPINSAAHILLRESNHDKEEHVLKLQMVQNNGYVFLLPDSDTRYSQLFCEQVTFPNSQCSEPPRPGRDLLPESPNQVRSKTEHEDEVTYQQDIWRVMIL